jgi:hypothetical protein
MSRAKNYRALHERVIARPGAEGRVDELRAEALGGQLEICAGFADRTVLIDITAPQGTESG